MTEQAIQRMALIQTTRLGEKRPDIGLGTGFLKAYVEDKRPGRYEIELFESNDFMDNVLPRVADFDLVGVSSVSNLYGVAQQTATAVKQASPDTITVLGGAHISALPESLAKDFDYGVSGEGEITFAELLDGLEQGLDQDDLAAIPGMLTHQDGRVRKAQPRPLMDDLSEVPPPSKDLFNKYRAVPSLMTARGCPYQCSFCTNNVIWLRKVRRLPPKRVVEELLDLVEKVNDVRVIVFRDDIMFINPSYVAEVLEHAERMAPHILEIPKVGYSHVNVVTPEFVDLLKRFGITKIMCGLESGSERVLQILKAGRSTVEQNQRAIDIAREHGLYLGGNFIIGTPHEEESDVVATYEFIVRNLERGGVGNFSTSILTPFPGSGYWDIFTKDGFDAQTFDWERLDELAMSTYWENQGGQCTVADWWKVRKAMRKIYMGSLPEERFLTLIERYEPRIMDLQAAFIKQDRKY